jgi:N6-adenosine-specific RNA methylase IME4
MFVWILIVALLAVLVLIVAFLAGVNNAIRVHAEEQKVWGFWAKAKLFWSKARALFHL